MFISAHLIQKILFFVWMNLQNNLLKKPGFIPPSPGKPARYDYEYKRNGTCNIFLACEPLNGKRIVKITERKTKQDWAYFLDEIALQREDADKITLIMDNLNTHVPGSLYETFPPVSYTHLRAHETGRNLVC